MELMNLIISITLLLIPLFFLLLRAFGDDITKFNSRRQDKKNGIIRKELPLDTINATYSAQVDKASSYNERAEVCADWALNLFDLMMDEDVPSDVKVEDVIDKCREALKYNSEEFAAVTLLLTALRIQRDDAYAENGDSLPGLLKEIELLNARLIKGFPKSIFYRNWAKDKAEEALMFSDKDMFAEGIKLFIRAQELVEDDCYQEYEICMAWGQYYISYGELFEDDATLDLAYEKIIAGRDIKPCNMEDNDIHTFIDYWFAKAKLLKEQKYVDGMDKAFDVLLNGKYDKRIVSDIYVTWFDKYDDIALVWDDEDMYKKGITKLEKAVELFYLHKDALSKLMNAYFDWMGEISTDAANIEKAIDSIPCAYKDRFGGQTTPEFNLLTTWSENIDLYAQVDPNTSYQEHYIHIGKRMQAVFPHRYWGYRLEAKGLLYLAISTGNVHQDEERIVELFDKIESIKESEDVMLLELSSFYAMRAGEEGKACQYVESYLRGVKSDEARQCRADELMLSNSFAQLKHDDRFKDVLAKVL